MLRAIPLQSIDLDYRHPGDRGGNIPKQRHPRFPFQVILRAHHRTRVLVRLIPNGWISAGLSIPWMIYHLPIFR